jgi:hypothetical protein
VAVRIFTAVLYILGGLLLAASAATGVTIEREKDTWTGLTSTPLESSEIIKAKILGAFWRVRGLLVALIFVWLVGLFCGAVYPLGFLAALAVASTALTFIAVLGTYFSLRSKSSARAIAATIVTLVIVSGGSLMCCDPLSDVPLGILAAAGCPPLIVPCALLPLPEMVRLLQFSFCPPSPALIILTGFLCLALYGSLALVLYYLCLNRFELEVDRPRRDFPEYRGKGDARTAIVDARSGSQRPSPASTRLSGLGSSQVTSHDSRA